MKRLLFPVLSLIMLSALFSCKSIQENIDARKNLTKCKYEFIKIEPVSVTLDGVKLKSVQFDAKFRITNTTKTDVAMDKISGTILLDNNQAGTLTHARYVKIKKGASAVEPISISIPFKSAMKALGHMPKYITFDLKVYMNLIIGKYNLGASIPVNVKIKTPVPYDTIKKMMVKQAKKSLKSGAFKKFFN